MNIIDLLENYKKIRDSEAGGFDENSIGPPSDPCDKIRTLDYSFFMPLSPMLKRRFEFCSYWKDAYLSQDWLSIQEINEWKKNKKICEWIALRKENYCYPGQPLADFPMKKIAIFSINPYEAEEIYLVFEENNAEPKIWHYFGADFYAYNNFERFLLYINGLIEEEDTIRKYI